MFVQSKMTKSGEPTAFFPNTLHEHPLQSYDISGKKISYVEYSLEAFWITTRTNGRMGLAFGRRVFRFTTAVDALRGIRQNMTYQQLIDAVEPEDRRARAWDGERDETQNQSGSTLIIWDGLNIWSDVGDKTLVPRIAPQLLTAFPALPAVPAGTDGWYKLKSTK